MFIFQHISSVVANLNIPAGYQQLVLAKGQSDLKLLQQFEELRQVALGETFGLKQKLLHHRALNNSFRVLPNTTALYRQFLHRDTDNT